MLIKIVYLLRAWQRRVDKYRIKKLQTKNFRLRKSLEELKGKK